MQRPSQQTLTDQWKRKDYTSRFYMFGVLLPPGAWMLRRTEARYPDLAAVHREVGQVIARLPDVRMARLLVDMRLAPPSNDPAFEQAMAELRQQVATRAVNVIVLVATASGSMQVSRLQRDDGTSFHLTRDPAEALRLVAG